MVDVQARQPGPASPRPRPRRPDADPRPQLDHRRRSTLQAAHPPSSHAKGPTAQAAEPFSALFPRHFRTHHQPDMALPDVTSRRKTPVLRLLRSRDKSQAPILRPSNPCFCPFCVSPRHRQQNPFPPFYHPPDTFSLYPPRSYPGPRYSEAQ